MVVNFRARGISRGARKLARTPTLNIKKKTRREVKITISPKYFPFLEIHHHEPN